MACIICANEENYHTCSCLNSLFLWNWNIGTEIHLLSLLIFITIGNYVFSQEIQQTPIEYIRAESVGGKLDFNKKLEEEGQANKLLLFDGVAYSSKGYSLILWGQAVKRLGIPTFKEASELWEEVYKTELSKSDLKALKKGYKLITQ